MSAETNHTPGPWRTDRECDHECVLGANGMLVADCAIFGRGRQDAENQANARLIAAAPDQHAALQRIVDAGDEVPAKALKAMARIGLAKVQPW